MYIVYARTLCARSFHGVRRVGSNQQSLDYTQSALPGSPPCRRKQPPYLGKRWITGLALDSTLFVDGSKHAYRLAIVQLCAWLIFYALGEPSSFLNAVFVNASHAIYRHLRRYIRRKLVQQLLSTWIALNRCIRTRRPRFALTCRSYRPLECINRPPILLC